METKSVQVSLGSSNKEMLEEKTQTEQGYPCSPLKKCTELRIK